MASESGDTSLNFFNLLLRCCQQEFLKDRNDDEALINRQKELDDAQDVRVTVTDAEKQSSLSTNVFFSFEVYILQLCWLLVLISKHVCPCRKRSVSA